MGRPEAQRMNLVVAAPGVYMNLFDEEDQFSAESFRYSYFPDFYAPLLRDPTVNASEFDPVSCVLYTNNKQYEHVMERGAEDLLHEIKAECEGLTPAEQETFVLNNTSFSHELRHFHDLIGTAAGLQRFVLIAGDVARFVASLFELKRGGLSRVPMQWCKDERLQKDRPYVLEYVTEHRHTVETVAILDGAVFVPNEEPIC
jgi:hypothetical protein